MGHGSLIGMASPRPALTTPVLLLMALATGLCVGANYVNQPLLDTIATALGTSHSAAAFTVTVAQVSYALGLLFLVPLGDMLDKRRLAVGLMILAAAGQVASGFAPNIGVLTAGIAVTGLFSVAAQVLVPFAATLAEPERSGRAIGTVMSGLLLGILSARSVAGLLAELGGWTTVYRAGAVALIVVAVALWRKLPSSRPTASTGYAATLRSLGTLARTHRRLRTRALLGAVSFGSLAALFSTMTFLLAGEPYGFGDAQIGLVGLAGAAGALAASFVGRAADRGYARLTTGISVVLLVASWAALAAGGHSLAWFLIGFVAVDLAVQGVHITNQNVVFALEPAARARMNSVYMVAYFVGGASGSALGTVAWTTGGWSGACIAGVALAVSAVGVWALDLRAERLAATTPPQDTVTAGRA